MSVKRMAYVISLLAILSGCDSKTASDANLEKGLNHYLKRLEPCSGYKATSFPMTASVGSPRTDLEALARVGLVSKTAAAVNGVQQIRYDITAKGRSSTFAGESIRAGEPNVFCFGEIEVDSISNFTEPAEADGMHVTRVTYTRKLTHQPSWAKDAAVQKAFPAYSAAGYETNPQTSGMILTSEGWRLPNEENR